MSLRRGVTTTLIALLAALAAAAPASAARKPLEVMTRNVYLGGDIQRPIAAAAGCPDQISCLVAVANANAALWTTIERTDFPARAKLLAAEIARHKPDVVGLQEVAKWRSGTLELTEVGVPNATLVDLDFLEVLKRELRARGAHYDVVVSRAQTDIEAPAFTGVPGTPSFGSARDVRLTMRDVLLKRRASSYKVLRRGGGQFRTGLSLSAGGLPVSVVRGFGFADLRAAGGRTVRVITTHLEAFSSGIALAQAAELLAGPASRTDRPVVLLGDFNSDPLDASTKPGDPTPHWAAYRLVTQQGGFTDTWPALGGASGPGFTSGLGELVNDADTSSIDHRIDFVFARPAAGGPAIRVDRGAITGLAARTPRGLWASDHAGVVVRLRP